MKKRLPGFNYGCTDEYSTLKCNEQQNKESPVEDINNEGPKLNKFAQETFDKIQAKLDSA